MSTVEKLTYTLIATILLIGFVLALYDESIFRDFYVVEDGAIEWLSVFVLLLIFWICIKRIIVLFPHRPFIFLLMTGLLGIFCLFGAGEEISWGQRIFNIESPEWFKQHNAQQETNLHNIKINDIKINKLIFAKGILILVVTYLFVITPLYRRNEKFKSIIDRLAIPIPKNHHIIAYMVALFFIEVLVQSSKKGELTELVGPLIFLMNMLYAYNSYIFDPNVDLKKQKNTTT